MSCHVLRCIYGKFLNPDAETCLEWQRRCQRERESQRNLEARLGPADYLKCIRRCHSGAEQMSVDAKCFDMCKKKYKRN